MAVLEGHLAHLVREHPQINEWQLCGSDGYLLMTMARDFKMAFAMKEAALATALEEGVGAC